MSENSTRPLAIGLATVNQTPLDWNGNLHRILLAIQEAKEQEIAFLCFPELSLCAYGSEDLFLSYWYPKKAWEQLEKLLPHTENISLAVGLPIRKGGKLYNCMAILENGSLKACIAKQFMAIDGVHYEFRWFEPWPADRLDSIEFRGQTIPFGDYIYTLEGHKIGFEICEDAWRGADRPAYRLAEKGVDLIFNPSASHYAMGKTQTREDLLMESVGILKGTYCYINLTGNESGRMIFDGETLIAQPHGIVYKGELLSFQPFRLHCFHYQKQQAAPLWPKAAYDQNEELTQAVSLALFDYLRKSRAKGFVLSLSGGADSSSIAVMVAEMVRRGVQALGQKAFAQALSLPPEAETEELKALTGRLFTTAYQGTENSSEATFASARMLAESIGARFHHWTIDAEVQGYSQKIAKALGRELSWQEDDLALQNIQARARSPIIWMLANIQGALLLTTSNRSEGDVGYATMDGDTSGSISPIAGLSKVFVLQWLRWAEKELGYSGLAGVNSLQPSAELRPLAQEQRDEEDLMPYPLLLAIECLAIREYRSPLDVYKNLLEEGKWGDPEALKTSVIRFFRLWSQNQWKRERLAPSFHLDDFNVDPKTWYRFPILSGGFREELAELEAYSAD
ncbi:NAD+ synthetase [Nitritalea halalkaliphila LW7]|uniref:Glutamine-dependent NAD(+) synthetase n=1 Tax=Nitritalea halalkaliphila LW7 TaxID=1189621 RepID=I5C2V5_9BACT|nr:NAD(+) synthase [Nitritalea halalkaliphila]EIM76157.1 NAD+ synthetase [Nitritalea halalkaliphila LW7]